MRPSVGAGGIGHRLGQNAPMRRLLLLAGIWGCSFWFIKVAVEGITPTAVAGGRVALGALVLLAVLRLRRLALPRDPRLWGHLAFTALVGNAIPFTLIAWGEERITSALTAVLNASTPFFTALACAVLFAERLRRVHVVGLVVGAVGVTVAAGIGSADLARSSLAGGMASVAAGACYGLAFAWMRRYLMGIPPIVAATSQLIAASVLLAPLAVATSVASGFALNPGRAAAMLALGALGTGIAYVLSYEIVAELGATRASLVTYLIPVVAVAVGVAVLGERFHPRVLVGAGLILAGIALVHDRVRPRPARAPAAT